MQTTYKTDFTHLRRRSLSSYQWLANFNHAHLDINSNMIPLWWSISHDVHETMICFCFIKPELHLHHENIVNGLENDTCFRCYLIEVMQVSQPDTYDIHAFLWVVSFVEINFNISFFDLPVQLQLKYLPVFDWPTGSLFWHYRPETPIPYTTNLRSHRMPSSYTATNITSISWESNQSILRSFTDHAILTEYTTSHRSIYIYIYIYRHLLYTVRTNFV